MTNAWPKRPALLIADENWNEISRAHFASEPLQVELFPDTVAFMRSCNCCVHPERPRIEDALLRKVSHAKIGEQFSVSLHSVGRHAKHLGRSIVVKSDTPLIDRVEALMARLESISAKAQSAKEWHAAVAAMKEVRCSLELLGKLTGQLMPAGERLTVGVAVNVSSGRSTNAVSDYDLDLQIAASVREATNDFDPRMIDKMKRLLQRHAPLELTEGANVPRDALLLETETLA